MEGQRFFPTWFHSGYPVLLNLASERTDLKKPNAMIILILYFPKSGWFNKVTI